MSMTAYNAEAEGQQQQTPLISLRRRTRTYLNKDIIKLCWPAPTSNEDQASDGQRGTARSADPSPPPFLRASAVCSSGLVSELPLSHS